MNNPWKLALPACAAVLLVAAFGFFLVYDEAAARKRGGPEADCYVNYIEMASSEGVSKRGALPHHYVMSAEVTCGDDIAILNYRRVKDMTLEQWNALRYKQKLRANYVESFMDRMIGWGKHLDNFRTVP